MNKSENIARNGFVAALLAGLRPYRRTVVIGLAAAALASAFDVAGPMLLKWGVDSLRAGAELGWLYAFSGLIVLTAAIGGVFRFFMRNIVIVISRRVETDIRQDFFEHLMKLAPLFFDRRHTGDLMARATDDIERVRLVLGPALLYTVSTGMLLVFSAAMMFYLDAELALIVMLLTPVIAVTVLLIAGKLHRANLEQQRSYGDLTSQVQENLTGIRVVKAFAREEHESHRFRDVCLQYYRRSMVVAKLNALFMPILALLIGFGLVAILWLGGQRVISGAITLGDFIAFMSYLSLMTWPMIAVGWVAHLFQRGKASHDRLMEIRRVPPQFVYQEDGSPQPSSEQLKNPPLLPPYFAGGEDKLPHHFAGGEDKLPPYFAGGDDKLPHHFAGGEGVDREAPPLSPPREPGGSEQLKNPPLLPPYFAGGEGVDRDAPPLSSPREPGGRKVGAPGIEYRGVTFAYRDSGDPVLRDLNLTIPSGATVAIVGRTGSGKSTVTRLLARLYEPQNGAIYLDGRRWDDIPVAELRALIGYVDQTTFLFSTTIRKNITFGMEEASEEVIRAAAYTACFDQDVEEFPDGYDTVIGERGITLSGGQQQRLALARALIMDTPILVLDDALSAVDTGTEAEILERLTGVIPPLNPPPVTGGGDGGGIGNRRGSKGGIGNRTTLFITHRLAAAEQADAIAVIQDGGVAEFGSHHELLSRDSIYAAMHRRQRLAEELGEMV